MKFSRPMWIWVSTTRVKTRRQRVAALFSAAWPCKQRSRVTTLRRQVTEYFSDKWTSRKVTRGRTRRLLTDGHVPFW